MRQLDPAAEIADLPSLTGLRWVAALLVFGLHLTNLGYTVGTAQQVMIRIFGAGDAGVSLFFVLSGFVLTWSDRPGTTARGFWLRRFARVWPAHAVAVAAAVVVSLVAVPGIRTREPLALIANLALESGWNSRWWQAGNPVSWSLTCEAFFYLLFPLVILLLRRRNAATLVALGATTVLLAIAMPVIEPHVLLFSKTANPVARLPEFVLGVVAAILIRKGTWRGPRLAIAVPVAVLGYAASSLGLETVLGRPACTMVGFALLISALARADVERRGTLLSTAPLVTLGRWSFSFYLVHLLAIQVVGAPWGGHPHLAALPAAGLAVDAFALALGAGWLLHRGVEVPARKLVLRLGRPRRRPSPRGTDASRPRRWARWGSNPRPAD